MLLQPFCLMGLFPLSWALGTESAKQPKEDSPAGWSASRRQCSHSRGRDRSRQCQSPSPQCPSWCQSPSPHHPFLSCQWVAQMLHGRSPPTTEIQQMQEQGAVRWYPTPTEEKPPRKKQVRFDMDKELGEDPTLLWGLTLFLVEGTTKEWDNAPSPSTPCLWIPMSTPNKGPQHCPIYTGGARPKVPMKQSAGWSWSWPQSRPNRELDPVNHPCRWIHAEMERTRHPHWCKEFKASGRVSMGSQIIREGLSDSEALHYVQWQSVAFRLPATQQEALGVGCPTWLSGVCPEDFMLMHWYLQP